MTTGYITHPDFLKHEMGSHHPECPERIQAINDQLIRSGVDQFLHHLDAPLASEDQLELVHSPDHIAFVKERAPASGYYMLDGDTIMNPHTWNAALRAAGAAIDAAQNGQAGVCGRVLGHGLAQHGGLCGLACGWAERAARIE